ncbi:AAA family ATPase [Planosporangium thailandense]|uniref:Gluconokinase n=1 Tax=Planosporangium thailandense TaxID=765197 RepID=A0ABX0XRP2_9ACTN|nr:gluconokinase [Planosporangium thailandense]NJC68501.1 AAA family ATPase [Planosporangium thailandense]
MAALPDEDRNPSIILITGVSGSGKTTVGAMLAGRLGWRYAEADDFHPRSNVEKMAAGHPLTDEDRKPWLEAIGRWIDERRAAHEPGVVTSSGLKRAYRDLLRAHRPEVRTVFLDGSPDLIKSRMVARHGHFFAASMLDSQFADLEPPRPDEGVLTVSVQGTPAEIVDEILRALDLPAEPLDHP